MLNQSRLHIQSASEGRALRPSRVLWLFGLLIAAWLVAGNFQLASRTGAAEVNTAGLPVPMGFADIIERVKPAVVGVRVEKTVPKPGADLGSGFFISADGHLVTNYHVVANGKNIEVTADSGRIYTAEVIGTDAQTDLALIKVSADVDFPYAKFAEAPPRIGDWALVIGNPFGLGGTVTAGIVSAHERDIGDGPYDDFLQIDAPVNPGNSGGPTFNAKGEVIGVNTEIFTPSGGSVGIAFDIPAETVKFVVQQLTEKGSVTRGWLGLRTQSVRLTTADLAGLSNRQAIAVARLEPNGPAAKAGIELGDIITSANGEPVNHWPDLSRKVAALAPGASIDVGLIHNGQDKTVTVTLGVFPQTEVAAKKKKRVN